MKKRFLFLAASLFLAIGMAAQRLYDVSGNTIGRIDGDVIYRGNYGKILARFESNRVVDVDTGQTLNRFDSNGRFYDKNGNKCLGRLESNGQVDEGYSYNKMGTVKDGFVFDRSGNRIGKYENVSDLRAAYFFFFFKKDLPASSAPKPLSPNARTTKANQITLYDRNKRPMGTLYGKDYFLSSTKNGPKIEFKKTDEGLTILRDGKYLANVGKDGKTVYTKHGEEIYSVVDEQGNAYLPTGEQYGVIREDGQVFATKDLDMPFGIIAVSDYDRHLAGLIYFVCYYGILHDYYKKIGEKKE